MTNSRTESILTSVCVSIDIKCSSSTRSVKQYTEKCPIEMVSNVIAPWGDLFLQQVQEAASLHIYCSRYRGEAKGHANWHVHGENVNDASWAAPDKEVSILNSNLIKQTCTDQTPLRNYLRIRGECMFSPPSMMKGGGEQIKSSSVLSKIWSLPFSSTII